MPSPLGAVLAICRGQTLRSLATSQPRKRQPCNDSIASLSSLGFAPRRRRRPLPPPPRPSRLCAAPPVPGEPPGHLAPLVPGHCALVATTPGAQLPARSLPETLSGVACLAPGEHHYPIASRFTRRLGAEREPERSLSTLQGGGGASGEGRRAGSTSRAARPERQAPADAGSAGEPRSSAPGRPEPRDGVSISAPRSRPLPGSQHVAMATEAAGPSSGPRPGWVFRFSQCVCLVFL